MPQVGFELTISVFERAKTVHALDGAATVIGYAFHYIYIIRPVVTCRIFQNTEFQHKQHRL
jgi:hypothetical protein